MPSWPTLAEAQRRGSAKKGSLGRVEKLPAIERAEAQLEAIRNKIKTIQGKKGTGQLKGEKPHLKDPYLSERLPERDRPPSAGRLRPRPRHPPEPEPRRPDLSRPKMAPSVSCPALQRGKVLASLQQDLYGPSRARDKWEREHPAKETSSALAVFLGMQQPRTFGALQLGGPTESIANAAVARRERAARGTRDAVTVLSTRVPRMFESITWTPGPLRDEMRSAIGKWVRGTMSGPQCKVCLDYVGWPHPFGEPDLNDLAERGAPLDRCLPALSGMPGASGADVAAVFSKDLQVVLQDFYARCAALCGEVCFAEQVWLAARVLGQRAFSRCHAGNLSMYRSEEILAEALRQKFVGSPVCPEMVGLRELELGDGSAAAALKCTAAQRVSKGELDAYFRRQLQLRQELLRQNDELKRDEAYSTLGLSSRDGVDSSLLKKQYWQLAKERHPDRGGSHEGFQELQSAYRHLLEAPDGPSQKSKVRRKLGHETRPVRDAVAQLQVQSYDCAALVQQAFRELRSGRLSDWMGLLDEAAGKARLVGEAAEKLALDAVDHIEQKGMHVCLSVLPDAADTCKTAGSDTAALSRRLAETICDAIAERLMSKDSKARMLQQHRMLALGLYTALAASDAGMACSELAQLRCYEVVPEPKPCEPSSPIRARDARDASPPPRRSPRDDDSDGAPLGRSPKRGEFDGKCDSSPKAAPPEDRAPDRDTVVTRMASVNADLLDLQKQLKAKIALHPGLGGEAAPEMKQRVFALLSAFLDDACLEFAKRLATRANLRDSLDAFWWLTAPALAVPTGVQGVVLRSALGLDAQALRKQVSGELFPRLRTTLLKLRGRRAIPVPAGAEKSGISDAEEAELREREAAMLARLEPSGS